MAVAHETIVFDIHDAKVYPMLTDALGGSPTFSAAVDVPGISDCSMEPNLVTAELKGDARIMARRGRTDRFKVSMTYSKIAIDVLAVILGGTVTDTGSTEASWELKSPAPLPYFKTEFKVDDVDVGLGTIQVILYKCQLTGGTLFNQSSDNFGKPTLQLEAIQPESVAYGMGKVRLLSTNVALGA